MDIDCKNYYKILHISPKATKQEIKKAYLEAVKKHHPDKFFYSKEKQIAEEKIKEINEAFEILYNQKLREDYNKCYEKYFSNINNNTEEFVNQNKYNNVNHGYNYNNTTIKKNDLFHRFYKDEYSKFVWVAFAIILLLSITKIHRTTNKDFSKNYKIRFNYNIYNNNLDKKHMKSINSKNLDIDKYCDNRNMQKCLQLGFLDEYSGNYDKAQLIFKKACDNNIAQGCCHLGNLYFNGYGVKQNYKKSKELYKKACEKGDYMGCCKLGNLYFYGYGVKKNYKNARKLYKKACEKKIGEGCYELGILYINGYGVKINRIKAKKLFYLACKNKYKKSCVVYKILLTKNNHK